MEKYFEKKEDRLWIKGFVYFFLILIFIVSIFYDISFSTSNFPVFSSFLFVVFIIYRFLRPIFR